MHSEKNSALLPTIEKPAIEPSAPTVEPVIPPQKEPTPPAAPESDPDYFRPKRKPAVEPAKD